ncbi:Uncharacterised protein [Vibrio cholerae]|nr:Uncharacterised protein [Vibrio cholerae]
MRWCNRSHAHGLVSFSTLAMYQPYQTAVVLLQLARVRLLHCPESI